MLSYHPVKIAKQRDSSWSITGTGNRHSGIRVISCGRLHCFHAPNIIAINGVVSCVDTDATNAVFSDNDEIFSTLNLLARSSETFAYNFVSLFSGVKLNDQFFAIFSNAFIYRSLFWKPNRTEYDNCISDSVYIQIWLILILHLFR